MNRSFAPPNSQDTQAQEKPEDNENRLPNHVIKEWVNQYRYRWVRIEAVLKLPLNVGSELPDADKQAQNHPN